ncbi:unnamed protein product [Acanthoscelides obtectus]|uniref:Prefoldin subunit 1 n=1 Tax=Acanthoscelides obtectus TaxID=200917 RepID=A0A9P0M2W1_ACAOB|nr:unnamed protein product [Acanthoscelides obtectus]CAK1670363.1 Prefoldin subunit 1 [Acanthoscelides obtectus]
MAKVDMELKRAFAELQQKQVETAQKLRIADMQIENSKRQKLLAAITEREISTLDEGTRMYESIGRMFFLTPASKVKENLQAKQTSADEKIKVHENNKVYLETSLKEAANNLRELVQLKKDS